MQKLKKKKILVAMSGGVDSSVAAYLLLKQGYDVVGATMDLGINKGSIKKNPEAPSGSIYDNTFNNTLSNANNNVCNNNDFITDARKVCDKLGISHYVFNLSEEFEKNIINGFINTYLIGKTPNPCIECNRVIKFGILLEKAILMGFDFFATGHYASILIKNGDYFIGKASDLSKDQSYFLYGIKKEKLPFIKFPLSSYNKEQVKDIAKEAGLEVHGKKESQEVCFITDNNYHEFIKGRLGNYFIKPGDILDVNGKIIGSHKGLAFYTIGQRKGFGISHEKPLYVININIGKNEITVGERAYLSRKGLVAENLNWFVDELPNKVLAKIRYNHQEVESGLDYKFMDNTDDNKEVEEVYVSFAVHQESVTPGQSVVFYDGEDNNIIIGGGIIARGLD